MSAQVNDRRSGEKCAWQKPRLTRIEMKRTLHFGGTGHDNKHQNDIPPGSSPPPP